MSSVANRAAFSIYRLFRLSPYRDTRACRVNDRKRETTAYSLVAYKEQQTLVFADGSAAAQEAQEEKHASHAQDDVDAGEQQRVGRHDFPESRGVHQHPHANPQEEGAPKLQEWERHKKSRLNRQLFKD